MMPADNFNKHCEAMLKQYTHNNPQAVSQRLERLCEILTQKGNVAQTMFGGSVL